MFGVRAAYRLSRSVASVCRSSLSLCARQNQPPFPLHSDRFHSSSLLDSPNKLVTGQLFLSHNSLLDTHSLQQFGFFSTSSPDPNEKEAPQSRNEQDSSTTENNEDAAAAKTNGDADETEAPPSAEAEVSAQEDESDSDSDSDSMADLSKDELLKIVKESEELLKQKYKEIEEMKDKVLRTYAEMENVMARTRREAENSKKFAIQNFAKSLLDVADNLGRASSVAKDSFSKFDDSKSSDGAVALLKTLLEGVEMTKKQLAEVLKKFGVEKYDPTNEQFDPHRHNAVFQVQDPSKPADTIAVVLKPGYTLYDRIIRPAEVGVTVAADNEKEE